MSRVYAEEEIGLLEPKSAESPPGVQDPTTSMSELEIPEVFELRLLSTRRVLLKIVKDEPAPFYFVDDDDVGLPQDIELPK
jgi:hypothetical protein